MIDKRKHFNIAAIFLVAVGCCLLSCNNNDSKNGNAPKTVAELPRQIIEPANPYADVDKSPMDVSYYPVDYPKQRMTKTDSVPLAIRVIYSRPHKMGRVIFGNDAPPKNIQRYGAYWRLGANEATEIEFFKPVTIQEKEIPKGRYIIYCIPFTDKWTIVLNSNLFSFGLQQDSTKDLAKFTIPVQQTTENIEYFTMVFQKAQGGADLTMAWGNVKAILPIKFK